MKSKQRKITAMVSNLRHSACIFNGFFNNDTTNKTYVYVYGVNLNTRYFGLTVPFYMDENKHINQIIREVVNQYLKQNLILN